MEEPLVSIGIPAYNRPERLAATLRCIRNQTYQNLEIIVSDDCSPSAGVEQVVTEAISSGQNIKFYRQDVNLGATRNFEFVLRVATGTYFLWAEDEDHFEPEFVGKLVECMEADENLVACTCDINCIDMEDKIVSVSQLNMIRPEVDWNEARKLFFCYPTSNVFFCILGMFRTECLKKVNIRYLVGWKGYETNGEVPFLAQIAVLGRMAAIPLVLKSYRLNPNSIYHSEIRSISGFDWFSLRLQIRLRLCGIALRNELQFRVKLWLVATVFQTHFAAIFALLKGAIMARLARIMGVFNRGHNAAN